MKNADIILKNIISRLPAKYRKNAMEILKVRFLAKKSALETSEILGIPYNTVCDALQAVKKLCKGKFPADFA